MDIFQKKRVNIGIITSRGGHLFQMIKLRPFWSKFDRFWVTYPGKDTNHFLKKERVYFASYPESRNIASFLKNLLLANDILKKERPSLLVSCGAGIAPPFFYIGKLKKSKLIFIEPYDFIKYPSLTSKMLIPIVNKYLVQHKSQLKFSQKTQHWGQCL